MAENKKSAKTNSKSKTVLEVNEITEETIKEEELKQAEKQKREKEEADRLRKEKVAKTFEKIFKGYDINNIAKILMWAFFFVAATYVNINVFRQTFSAPALKIFVTEESLKDISSFKVDKIDDLTVKVDSFDISVKESDSDEIVVRYSKKYDKKINTQKKGRSIIVEEKKKIFKLVKYDSSNNAIVIEIPRQYKGSLEIESTNGSIKIEKYKILNETEEVEVEQNDEFYKNFFNI